MQQLVIKKMTRIVGVFIFLLLALTMQAQNKIEIDKQQVSSWFEQNWIWVVAGMVLLFLLVSFSRRGGVKRKTTTIIKDEAGNIKKVTTTEERS